MAPPWGSFRRDSKRSAFLRLRSTTLLTVTFHNSGTPGSYPITLALNPSASPSFIDFATQSSLDPSITFQTATITVLPEPATLLLPLLALPLLCRRRTTAQTPA